MRRLVVPYLVLVGCTESGVDPTATCGNGIVDPGEICLERVAQGGLDFGMDLGVIPACTIQLHDIDGDGIDELVTTGQYLRVWRYTPDQEDDPFVPWLTRTDVAFSCPAFDPERDLWIAPSGADIVSSRLGADATFTQIDAFTIEPSGLGAETWFWEVRLADVDGDGTAEVVGHTSDFNLVVLELDGDGRFEDLSRHEAGANEDLMEIGDFDGDGRDDVVLWSAIHFGAALGSPVDFAVRPFGRAVADVDGDGIDDLLGTKYTDDGAMLGYWLGDRDEPLVDVHLFPSSTEVRSVYPIELDLQAPTEFIGYGIGGVDFFQFDAELVPQRVLPLEAPYGSQGSSVHFGRLNDDAVPDIIIPTYGDVLPESSRPYGVWLSAP